MEFLQSLTALATQTFGRPVVILGDEANPVPDWGQTTPTQADLDTFAQLVVFARSGVTGITFAEWQALDAAMADDRTLRQMTRNQFMAQTADARDRQVFDVLTAHSKMLRALTRDKR